MGADSLSRSMPSRDRRKVEAVAARKEGSRRCPLRLLLPTKPFEGNASTRTDDMHAFKGRILIADKLYPDMLRNSCQASFMREPHCPCSAYGTNYGSGEIPDRWRRSRRCASARRDADREPPVLQVLDTHPRRLLDRKGLQRPEDRAEHRQVDLPRGLRHPRIDAEGIRQQDPCAPRWRNIDEIRRPLFPFGGDKPLSKN